MTHVEICRVLSTLRPGARWNLRGDGYDGIEWLDEAQAKPTPDELTAAHEQFIAPAPA